MTTTTRIPETHDHPHRLGRHVQHDPRSHAYAVGVLPKTAIKSAVWARRIPILDQGSLGSCTANALTGLLGTDSAGRAGATEVTVKADSKGVFTAGTYTLDEDFAARAYRLNTLLDSFPGSYPPDDTGSSGIACGKTAKALGLATSYSHAFSLDALKSALQTGPALIGIMWLNSMFDPKSDGTLNIDHSSGIAGGHELVVSGYDAAAKVFRLDNSWAASWGDQGSCYVTEADMSWLLAQDGDVTAPYLVTAPVPVPTVVTAAEVAADIRALLMAKGL